ncbi:hypothetical protein DV096_00650 [Bradymonadaceae bacterium TMQ3]|nr:hypothetical protein DV096_00650 [Bradymonadaceae bacterium TMQ3]
MSAAALTLVGSVWLTGCESQQAAPHSPEPLAGAAAQASPGSRARASNYRVESPSEAIVAGASTEVALAVVPGANLKINLEYPWKITFEEVEGLQLGTTVLNREALQLSEARATIPLEVSAEQPGDYTLNAVGNFSVCNDDRCDILRDEALQFTVKVQQADQAS